MTYLSKAALAPAVAVFALALCLAGCQTTPRGTNTAAARKIDRDSRIALRNLYANSSRARSLKDRATAVLVFPNIMKGGFIFGGQSGNGALFRNGNNAGYFNTSAASWGLQAGLQKFGYAVFFMNDAALAHLDDSRGWEIGSAPNLTVVDAGVAGSLTTTTAHQGVYAFFFNQRGLMGGITLEGSKITRIYP